MTFVETVDTLRLALEFEAGPTFRACETIAFVASTFRWKSSADRDLPPEGGSHAR
jgi:hypothetical protein